MEVCQILTIQFYLFFEVRFGIIQTKTKNLQGFSRSNAIIEFNHTALWMENEQQSVGISGS